MDKDGLENEIMKGHEEFGGDWFFFLTVVMINPWKFDPFPNHN